MSWLIDNIAYTGKVVTVGTGKDYATVTLAEAALTEDTLFLVYDGAHTINYAQVPNYNLSYKNIGTATLASCTIEISAGKACIVEGFTGGISYLLYPSCGAGATTIISRCSNANMQIQQDTAISYTTIRYCTSSVRIMAPTVSGGIYSDTSKMSIHRCQSAYTPDTGYGGYVENDCVTTATPGYGVGYGADYIVEVAEPSITVGPTVNTPLDANTPPATHVAWINSRFIANEKDTNRFDFTDTNPLTGLMENNYWSSSDNPVTCDSKGDKLSALFTAWQEIYAWGTQGLQVFQDDGSTPFVNVPGAAAEVGIEAIYSIKKIDNTIYALCTVDNKRVVIKLQGRAPQVISEPIASVLSGMEKVSDAIGDVISVGGLAIYLLTFPTANQTWAYDYKNEIWLRWGYWNSTTGTHDRFIGQHSCFVKRWNKHLIMSRIDGKVYEMSRNVFDDANTDMVSYRRTGWIDWGDISKVKHSRELFIKTKTFSNDGTTTPTMLLRWRDDGYPVWSNFVELSLDPVYFGDFIIHLTRMGTYRSRQYEFRLSDEVDMALVNVQENVT